ncbi:hypothetical protein ACSF85_08280 [Moraxella bovoculi]
MTGFDISFLEHYFGRCSKKFVKMAGVAGFLDKVTTSTNKTGDDYLRVD